MHHHNKSIPHGSHANHFMNPNLAHFQSNAGHYSMGHYGVQQPQQYDKAQYITMNISMNMYPNVMNINMTSPPQHPAINAPTNMQTTSLLGPSNSAKTASITLESNINLDTLGLSLNTQKKSE